MYTKLLPALTISMLALLQPGAGVAQDQDFSDVQIETIPVAEGLFMLVGSGGNVGLFVGDDGAFLVDDQYAPLTEKLTRAVAAQTDKSVRFVINTHWHGDHTGGNEAWGGSGAVLIAHDNVRSRMSTEQFWEVFDTVIPASPEGALPVLTFSDAVTFHWNGDEVRVFHVAPAHTDGDAIVHFVGADVLHAGDTYFNGIYPFIDVSSGGTLGGMIAAADTLLAIAGPDTKIIPGHGPLSTRAELSAYRDLLETVRTRIGALIADGRTRDEVVAAAPMREYDQTWGNAFIEPEMFTGLMFDALKAEAGN